MTTHGIRASKLSELARQWGKTFDDLLAESVTGSTCPAICMSPDCNYTTEYEPDQREGFCEACDTTTVVSALVLANNLLKGEHHAPR